ncbi:MFS transporter [Burkholderia oklahomensis]|uniref:MFS transporter n=1 Tax=Burkholderia oklahomensis TaxID=342113 RepID=UPI00016A82C5|nr:nitrate/nitrite transporter [Burkholderia oklahomensis]AOI45475.1 MFS transporter [Burkholderia oklahomensis C6786]KUY57499.1 MFS transporter [Burkholderia oklahomensis C6786]MBI0358440.1 NarK/NasA family nitrate transporter [Burkholderia oklahomensis]SUW56563.1 Probable nitrate transporter narT [Burkholderia oklahomensis]
MAATSAPPASLDKRAMPVLASSTIAFTLCFAVWMMFAILGIPLKKTLGLNDTEFGLVAAMPVLTGSLIRVPLGIWTDRYGGRIVFFILMLVTVVPIWLISYATQLWQFLVLGLFVGLAGGSFSVGTPYVARWFPKARQGLAMGVFGAGNSGAAVNKFVAPALIAAAGTWTIVPRVYSIAMLAMALLFWVFSATDPAHRSINAASLRAQLRVLRNPRVWRYSQYYSVVFGGYVGLSLWLTQYYVGEYGFGIQSAAFLAACFSLPGGVLRAIGGWLSDRYGAYRTTWWVMWVCWVTFFILSYPPTDFTIRSAHGPLGFHLGHTPVAFTVLLFAVGIAMAIGKASVFKFIADEFPDDIGAVSGVVGLAGGLAGFALPILFGALVDLTGVRSTCFMLLYGAVSVSLVWMYFSFRAERAAHDQRVLAARSA